MNHPHPRRHPARRRPGAAVVSGAVSLVAGLALAGCGLAATAPTAAPDAPDGLFTTTTVAVADTADSKTILPVYFIDDSTNALVRVDRRSDTSPVIDDVVRAVMDQPIDSDKVDHPGIASRFPPYDNLKPVAVGPDENGILTVTMSGVELSEVAINNAQRVNLAYSQIVCTMVALRGPDIEGVLLRDDAGDIPFRTAGSETVLRPVGPSDVNDCMTGEELAASQSSTTSTGSTTPVTPTSSPN
ncbi:MAG: GerMN domain-containing protein [Acidimicrobiales bacterium]